MCGCNNIDVPLGNQVGKSMERRRYVLYSLIRDIPIGGKSMEGSSGMSGVRKKRLISSTSVLALVCVEINDKDCNS